MAKTNYQPIITLWKKTSKDGKTNYFSGVKEETAVVGFYNSLKKNPQEPDLRIYPQTDEKNTASEIACLWCNVSERTGKKYLTGHMLVDEDQKVKITGFIQESTKPNYPYLKIYLQSDLDNSKESKVETKEEKKEVKKETKKAAKKEDLPF